MMTILTILNDGDPWIICKPENDQDLEAFLSLSSNHAIGVGFTHRLPTPREEAKWSAEYVLRLKDGTNPDLFFGVPA
jgi:hypothetical protein